MGSGSSAQYKLTAEEARALEAFFQEVPSLRAKAQQAGLHKEAIQRDVTEEETALEQAPGSAKATSSSSGSHKADCYLHFTVRDKPAVLDQKIDVAYLGNIRTDAESCVVSFPGKYTSAWEALTKEKHSHSVACVFLSTPEDGLGRHSNNPISGKCYCHEIYGERDYKTFGYLKVLPTTCTAAQEQLEREKAKSTNAVVVRADASDETRKAAEQEAQQAWEKSGKTASWGCAWFEEWKNRVAQAVKLKQRLKVVFFVGQVDDGTVDYDKLPLSDLWNGIGIGGSQKGEVAYLNLMREKHGEDWAYDSVDVAHFLTEEFYVGAPIYALDGEQWCRGTLLAVPEEIPKDPKDAQWIVQLRSGKVFSTNRLRHADEMEQILAKIGENHFMEVVKRMLPVESEVADGQRFLFQDGRLSYAIRLGIKTIEALQQVRNLVLSNDLETLINHALEKKGTLRLQVDKTAFCKNFESELLRFSKLTEHQLQRLQDINKFLERGPVHLSAPAGAGKTFVAVQCALKRFAMHTHGNVLFVAPSIDLGLFFARWIAQRHTDRLLTVTRLVLMQYPYDQFLHLQIKGHLLKTTPMPADTEPFLLTIIDESHDVLQLNHSLMDKIKTQQLLLLSSQSQASGSVTFPKAHDVELKQIVRSTKRIVAGAAAFQSQAAEKKGITSLCPAGPPIKTFLFEDSAPETLQQYGEKTAAAVLYVMHSYAGLSLHNRLALLVPDHDFLQKFSPVIREYLRLRCPGRCFQLTSFEESLSVLPNLELRPTIGEKIVLDTVEHAKGLEQLMVVCVGLDEPVGRLSTCAKIYQAMTRAQLQAIVVNRLLRGGWLEFLGLMTFKEETFDEVAAMAETTTDAAAQAISVPGPVPGPPSRTKKPMNEGSDPSAEPKTSLVASPDAETSSRQSLLPRNTSVWDTEDNVIKEPIQHLQFDPRSQLETSGSPTDLTSEAADPAQVAADAAAAAKWEDEGSFPGICDAARYGDLAAVRGHLRADPAAARRCTNQGRGPLHFAAANGHVEVAELLLAAGAPVDGQNNRGQTPLHRAAFNNHIAVAKVLLAAGASPHVKDEGGQTPLHDAAAQNHIAVAKVLLAAGASPHVKDNDGQTPLNLARGKRHSEMVSLLEAA